MQSSCCMRSVPEQVYACGDKRTASVAAIIAIHAIILPGLLCACMTQTLEALCHIGLCPMRSDHDYCVDMYDMGVSMIEVWSRMLRCAKAPSFRPPEPRKFHEHV